MPLAARTNRGSTFTKRNKMNSKKFLDQLGLIALISKIKQALNGKQNVDMVVTIAQSGNAYSCDTSIANIVAAHDAGRDVYAVLPPVSDGSSTKIELVEVQNYGSGTVMMVSFGGIINNGTNNVLYSVSGTRQNNLDVWSVSQKTMQEKLVSGTSIKTVNGNTLLGSGDVTINGSERATATWNASTSAYVSGASVDDMYQSFYTDGKVLELHFVNGNYNGMVLTCHGGYTDGSVRHMKFCGIADGLIVECDVVGTAVTITYSSLQYIYETLDGKQDTIGLSNKVDADFVEYRGADTSRLGNGDSMTEALQVLDTAITNLGTPNEIASITTQESSASGGNNVVTITDTDGTVTSFNVKNGKDGKDGADGADGVSLGEIALVQTTGDSEESVMSQRAVTAEVTRASMLEIEGSVKSAIADGYDFPYDLYYRLDWLSNENGDAYILTDFYPKDNTVRFTGAFSKIQATTTSTSASIISSYKNNYKNFGLWLRGTALDSIGVQYSHQKNSTIIALQDSSVDVWHTFDLSLGQLILDGEKIVLTTPTAGDPNNTPMRILDTSTKIRLKELCVYESDVLMGRFIPCKRKSDDKIGMWDSISGNFYAPTPNIALTGDSLTNSKLLDEGHYAKLMSQDLGDDEFKMMSQAAITREIEVAVHRFDTFVHVGGCLCYFALDDYPQFDPRECEGISVVFDGDVRGFGGITNAPYFVISNGNSISTTNPAYAITQGWSNIYGGMVQASNAVNNGCAVTANQSVYAHMVITLNFKTGEMVLYKNGVLTNSVTPANYDEEYVREKLASFTHMGLMRPTGTTYYQYTCAGMAMFGHILTQAEVTEIYGGGNESTKGDILPQSYYGYQTPPHIVPIYTLKGHNSTQNYTFTKDAESGDFTITMKANKTYLNFALEISTDEKFSGRCKREFDFTIESGTMKYTNTQYNGVNYKVLIVTDSNGNDVTDETLETGTYHASCIPTLIKSPKEDTTLQMEHKWTVATDTVVRIHSDYKLTDLGAALVCSRNNYRGAYWEQHDGTKLPTSTTAKYSTLPTTPRYDTYKPDTVIYNSSVLPQFNGQIAVDPVNGKVYIGYLTGTGGTWKQVSN